jgi:hypothetical protein
MLEFVCDTCHKRKKAGQQWILGLAGERVGMQSTQREINILSSWRDDQAVHPLAVHFCSDRCRDKYMNWLFSHHLAS